MASRSLGTLTVDLVAKVGGFTRGMTQAEREADKSAKAIQARMRKLAKGIDVAFQLAAAAAVAAFGALTVGVGRAIDRMDDIAKAAQKVGITTESFSKLAYAADLSGVSFEQLEGALAKLAKSQDMAAQGSKEQIEVFKALGLEFKNVDGTLRNTDDVLADLADLFQALPDGANKTAAAMALLGRSGAQLIPLLNGGSEGLAEMGDELDRFGGVVGPEAAKQAEQFNDNITRLQVAANGLWQALAADLLPDLVKLSEEFLDSTTRGNDLKGTVNDVADGIRALGTAAQFTVDLVQGLTNAMIGLYNVAKGLSQFNILGAAERAFTSAEFSVGEDFRNAGVAFEGVGRSFEGGGESPSGFDFDASIQAGEALAEQGRQAATAAENERKLAEALEEQRGAQERATAAKKADAEARKAAAEAAKREKEELEAQKKLAEQVFEQRMELVKLAAQEREERERAIEQGRQLRDDLKFELELMEMNNAERATAIQLRGLDAEAVRKYGDEIAALNEQIEREIELTDQMDMVRGATQGLFEDLITGSKSAKEAFADFVDSILAGIAEIVARQLTEQLLGDFGTTQTGAAGGGWASLLGSLFGGARAAGGPVFPGKAYLVGENGPELFRPMGAGNIVPSGQTAAMGAGGKIFQQNTFVLPGRYEQRTQAQIAADAGRASQRAISRSTA